MEEDHIGEPDCAQSDEAQDEGCPRKCVDQAERRVKLGLVVAEMISQFELTAEPAKVREAIEDIASTYQDPEEVINWYYSENEQLAGIESRVLEDAVVEQLLSTAAIAEVECSYQDALAKARPATPAE